MLTVPQVTVEATEERYRALAHVPTGATLDADGKGRWPADSFTYRLRNEGSIRVIEDEAPAAAATTDLNPPTGGRSRRA